MGKIPPRRCSVCGEQASEFVRFKNFGSRSCVACSADKREATQVAKNGEPPRLHEAPMMYYSRWIAKAKELEKKAERVRDDDTSLYRSLRNSAQEWRGMAESLVKDGLVVLPESPDEVQAMTAVLHEYHLPLLLVKYTLVFNGEMAYGSHTHARAA